MAGATVEAGEASAAEGEEDRPGLERSVGTELKTERFGKDARSVIDGLHTFRSPATEGVDDRK